MFGWFKRPPVPEFVTQYRHATPRRIDRKEPWDSLTYAVIDAETTGFQPGKDLLLSVGLLPIRHQQIDVRSRRSWLVQQTNAPNNEAVKIHGISPAASASGTAEGEVLRDLLIQLSGTVIVGHHIGFDIAMLNEALKRNFNATLQNPVIDTAAMASRHLDAFHKTGYANQRPPSLEEVCSHAGLPIMGRHTASGDAFTTAQFFLWMCSRLQIRHRRPLIAADLFR